MQYRLRSCCPVFRAKTPQHTKVKTRPQNIPCTIHLPTAFPTTNFSPFVPPDFVNSQSTIPPIVKFLPTPIANKKADHPVQSSLNVHHITEMLNISELLRILCKPSTTQTTNISHYNVKIYLMVSHENRLAYDCPWLFSIK